MNANLYSIIGCNTSETNKDLKTYQPRTNVYLHTYLHLWRASAWAVSQAISGACFRHLVAKPLPSVFFGSPFLVDLHKKENGEDRDFWFCGVGG